MQFTNLKYQLNLNDCPDSWWEIRFVSNQQVMLRSHNRYELSSMSVDDDVMMFMSLRVSYELYVRRDLMDKLVVQPSISDFKLIKLIFQIVIYVNGWTFVNPCSNLSIKCLLTPLLVNWNIKSEGQIQILVQ